MTKSEEHDDRQERRGDRRSAWSDPHFWVPIGIQAALWLIAVTSIIVTDRLSIASQNEKIANLSGQITTLQALVRVTDEQKGKLEAITPRIDKLEAFQSTQERAYNFNFTTRLASVEAKVGIRPTAKEGE